MTKPTIEDVRSAFNKFETSRNNYHIQKKKLYDEMLDAFEEYQKVSCRFNVVIEDDVAFNRGSGA